MQEGTSYIKDTGHFLKILRGIGKLPKDAILVTADVFGLHPSIPHKDGLKALRKKVRNRQDKKVAYRRISKHG